MTHDFCVHKPTDTWRQQTILMGINFRELGKNIDTAIELKNLHKSAQEFKSRYLNHIIMKTETEWQQRSGKQQHIFTYLWP